MKSIIKQFVEQHKTCEIHFYSSENRNSKMFNSRRGKMSFDSPDNIISYNDGNKLVIINLDNVFAVECD